MALRPRGRYPQRTIEEVPATAIIEPKAIYEFPLLLFNNMKYVLGISALLLTPFFAHADTLRDVVIKIGDIIQLIIPLMVAIALIAFFWGLVKYLFAQGNEDSKTDGKKIMLWGIVALFVMVSIWGIIRVIADTFNIQQGTTVTPPKVQIR